MANQEKQHRRGFMYIYKGGIGNQRKKELEHVVEQGKKSNSLSWLQRISRIRTSNVENGGHRSLDIGKETPPTEGGGFVEARKSTSWLELGSREGLVKGRKSMSSCIEIASKEIIVEEGRKSMSYIKTNSSKAGEFVEARKSVSQIETLSYELKHLKVKVLVSDMPSFMQVHAFHCAKRTYNSLEKFSSKHIAHNIKKVCFNFYAIPLL
ncbi:hypothetical protein TanjilG_13323 [Lupinus angustifolius]|uniref:Dynein light chain n=1 Tax=Lupinus angustifolius TaxID=3871 RepID=A0A4P1RUM8_LUPAN|nr:hypothetical protein TanjilG_13323 [Lupinus angustifolius]